MRARQYRSCAIWPAQPSAAPPPRAFATRCALERGPEFRHRVSDVPAHGVMSDLQLVGDLGTGASERDQPDDQPLALRERARVAVRRCGSAKAITPREVLIATNRTRRRPVTTSAVAPHGMAAFGCHPL